MILSIGTLVLVGFFFFDLHAAREYYEEITPEEENFFLWWVKQNVLKIGVAIGIYCLIFVALVGDVAFLRRVLTLNLTISGVSILVLTLCLVVFFAYDVKSARAYYENSLLLLSGDESFFRWWARLNVAKIGVATGVYLLGIILLVLPDTSLKIHPFVTPVMYLNLHRLSIPFYLTLVVVGFIAYDLRVAWNYYRNILLGMTLGAWPFLTWWAGQNRRKACVVIGVYLLAITGALSLKPQLGRDAPVKKVAGVATSRKSASSAKTGTYLARAEQYLTEQKFKEAVIEFRNAIQKDSRNVEAHLGLARSLVTLGAMNDAMKFYRNVVKLAPGSYAAYVEMAQLTMAAGNVELSLKYAQTAANLNPTAADPHLIQAQLYSRTGKTALAIQQCTAVFAREPTNPIAGKMLVNFYLHEKAFTQAATYAEKLLKSAPYDPDMKIFQAQALEGLNRSDEALTILRQAASADPHSPDANLYLGDLYMRRRDATAARNSYEEALRRSPSNPRAMNNIASLIADSGGDLRRAYGLATRLHQAFPDNPAYADTLGWILFRMGKTEPSLALLRLAASRLPQIAVVRYHLGVALLQTGDRAAARRELETYLRLTTDFDGAVQVRSLLMNR